jgi:uncharacterized RDD family membrane protein YckC
LIAAGTLAPESLVWREGMANWQPLAQARPSSGSSAAPGVAAPCAVCGGTFPPEALIRIADRMVCAQCKPVVLQQLQEGALRPAGQVFEYGGFWLRFVAKFIDGLIVGIPVFVLAVVVGFGSAAGGISPQGEAVFQLLLQLVYYALGGIYTILFVALKGTTPGKMAVGLKVVRVDGSAPGFGLATGRFFAEILSGLICYIGYIMAAGDAEKRSLHDHICGTRVVKK